MPLEQGKSQEAFEHNLKAELAANKPKEQALAIAYATQRQDEMPPSAVLDNVRTQTDCWLKP